MKTAEIQVYRDVPLIKSGAALGMEEDDFDLDWFRRQNQYISKLSDYDFWTVQAHTNRSHSWIGPYSRDGTIPSFGALGGATHITPLWPQIRKFILNGTYRATSDWFREFKNTSDEAERYRLLTRHLSSVPASIKREALELYKKDLKRIIANAPKSRKKMILYRGTGFDIFKGTPGHWHTLKSFCSAAYNIGWAKMYGRSMMERITILPGTAVLLVAGTNQWGNNGEYEIMVNIDTKYLIRFRNVLRHVYEVGKYIEKRKVTDVIITK